MHDERIVWKGSVMTSPLPPALVTCGDMDKPNILTIAWTGTLCTQPPKTYISIRPERYSYGIIEKSREFVINLPTSKLVRAVDFCGVKSGRDVNKFEAMGLDICNASAVKAPVLCDSPLSLECRVTDIVKLGSHDMFLADIIAVSVDPKYIDKNGRLTLEKAGLIAYSHGDYFALGEKLGDFGFSMRKKKTQTKKSKKKANNKHKA